MTNFSSMQALRGHPETPGFVAVTGASAPPDNAGFGSNPDLITLVVAMIIMLAAVQMLGRALAPLREVLRAVASVGFAALLILSALVLVLYAAVRGA
jgi:divalent metal cation (Fe/Co/Zn/Cd) transporter